MESAAPGTVNVPKPWLNREVVYDILVTVPVLGALVAIAASRQWSGADLDLLFWVAVVALAEMFPVPAAGGTQVTLSFPLVMAMGFIHRPSEAFLAMFVAALDPREFRREVTFWNALFNRSQAAVTALVGSAVFHAVLSGEGGRLDAEWPALLGAALLAAAAAYLANIILVGTAISLGKGLSIKQSILQLPIGNIREFLFFYIGLGLLGIPLARLFIEVPNGYWTVLFFMLPLLLARQMFSKAQALEVASHELKQREKVLRQLSSRMAEERYDERRQIATYLHDDLAQMLFRLGLQSDSVRSQLEKGEEEKALAALDNVEVLKDDSVRLVRGLIRDLDHSPLGRAGLATALTTLGSELSKESPTRFHLEVDELDLPAPIQLLAYQIAREAVQNAVKHAEPSNVWINLMRENGEVVLRVQDDGTGFDTSAPSPEGHFGLSIMRERAQLAGGKLDIRSQGEGGTQVEVKFHSSWIEQAREQESQDSSSS